MRLIVKKITLIISYGFVAIALTGCSIMHPRAGADTIGLASLAHYSGPKARIAVADFDVKAAKATNEIGLGVREMLIAALVNSNRFSVVELQQAQAAIAKEQETPQAAAASATATPQKDTVKAPDLIITASVSEFEPQASGGRGGLGGGGGVGSGILGGLLGASLNKAHMALDINILDTSTSKVLSANHVQGEASDVAKFARNGLFGGGGLAAGLSAYANTPMEKAIRICVIEVVRYMSQAVPATYYKYKG